MFYVSDWSPSFVSRTLSAGVLGKENVDPKLLCRISFLSIEKMGQIF